MARILVTLALALYNNVANLWPPFNAWAYVPANLLAAGVLVAVAAGPLNLSRAELGLADLRGPDALAGVAVGVVLAGSLVVLARTRRGARLLADRRVSGLRGRALAYQTFVRVPFGTALLEEVAFRGVAFAAWRTEGEVTAYLVSCGAFALWHVAPAAAMVRVNAPSATRGVVARAVAGTLVVTALAGAALVWWRDATGSLAAPFAAHATVNSLATVAGALAGRRVER
ncbi:MAG TPA: CPBP family intramembrane glutamic endopeptidase [Actinomycetota bacterium]|nr:CPBP family intramembrane glutamic endopeptidase [Actinomycetota bacterium]